MMTQPHMLVNMFFILSGDISPRPVKDFVGSVLEKIPKALWFFSGNNLCRYQDSHRRVRPWITDMISNVSI